MKKLLQRIGLLKPTAHYCIYREVRLGTYGTPLHILVEDNYQKIWHSMFPKSTWTPGKYAVGSFSFIDGQAYVAVCKDASAGTIAHEATHIAHAIMNYVGIGHCTKNDEAECYLVGNIADEIDHTMRHIHAKLHTPCR